MNQTLLLGLHAKDEPQENVKTTDCEKEESSDESEIVNVMGKDGGSDQTLENSKGAKTESCPKDGEELVKDGHGPATFREDEDSDLGDD